MLARRVTIVSSNRETLDGVQEYLHRAGARTSAVSSVGRAADAAREADAVVLFADDFPRTDSLGAMRRLAVALLVVVTEDVESFRAGRAHAAQARVVVLRRPAWGWMLLDALRSHDTEDPVEDV